MAPHRPYRRQKHELSLRRVDLTFFLSYMTIKSVDMVAIEANGNHQFHQFYFKNQGQMVSFSSESLFVLSIHLENLTLAIDHMNQTLTEPKNILDYEGINWAKGNLHLSLMESDFNLIQKHYLNFLKSLETASSTEEVEKEKSFLLKAIAGVLGVVAAINLGRNTYEIENIKMEMHKLEKNR